MTNLQKIEVIRAKCIEANPEIKKRRYAIGRGEDFYTSKYILPTIHIADVLVAIQHTPKTSKLVIDDYGVFWDMNTLKNSTLQEKSFAWNLLKDDLTLQSEETINFIYDLIT